MYINAVLLHNNNNSSCFIAIIQANLLASAPS